jgi:hypothetical protein
MGIYFCFDLLRNRSLIQMFFSDISVSSSSRSVFFIKSNRVGIGWWGCRGMCMEKGKGNRMGGIGDGWV